MLKVSVGLAVFVASFLFIFLVLFSSWMRARLSCNRFLFAIVSLFVPILALVSGCGLLCLIGLKINFLFIMSPIGALVFISREYFSSFH